MTGRAELVVGEDVVDEVLHVLEDKFGNHPAISEALEWLQLLLATFELIPRRAYQDKEAGLISIVRDRKDIPVLAGAIAADVDCLVTGDQDLLVLQMVARMRIRRTQEVLATPERD